MKIQNIFSLCWFSANRFYWCIRKGFPLRLMWCDIPFKDIPSSTHFGHPYGITIKDGTIFGENISVGGNVTIGSRRPFYGCPIENPAVIGNNCFLSAGCVILGGVILGDGAIIPANAVVKEKEYNEGKMFPVQER